MYRLSTGRHDKGVVRVGPSRHTCCINGESGEGVAVAGRWRSLFLGAAAAAVLVLPAGSQPTPAGGAHGEILWDTFGVPHVFGKDEAGVFYGFGYAQVKSHANLVLRLYGQAQGRAAEYWGEPYAESDRWVVTNGVHERAQKWYS